MKPGSTTWWKVQVVVRRAFVTQLGYVPEVGGKLYVDGEMFLVEKVEDLGGGKLRALVQHDPGFAKNVPTYSGNAPAGTAPRKASD